MSPGAGAGPRGAGRAPSFAAGLASAFAVSLLFVVAACASAGSGAPAAGSGSAAGSAAGSTAPDSEDGPADGSADGEAVPVYDDLGPHARPIVTASDRAQAYFDQGMLFMYAFGTDAAERAFRAARAEDPSCAACYWGEAWALAPYLNGGMPPGDERRAHAAIQRARELAGGASEVERALIETFAVRFEAEPDRDRRKTLDTLYASRMEEVAARFPEDLDVQTLYAEALMLLRPRRGSVDLEAEDVRRILPILEGVLARNVRHPGACHLYIHLVEASQEPERGERCADYLGDAIAVSHIRHMPSHIYMNVGRYGDAVRANQRAWHADQMASYGGPPGVYPAHNLHMLLFAAVMDGQSAVAIQAARDLAREQPPWAWYLPATLARFGRWAEILESGAAPEASEEPLDAAIWTWARGMAHLRTSAPARAREALARLDGVVAGIEPDATFRFHDLADVLALPRAILAAEIAHAEGRSEEAIAALEAGVAVEDGLIYDEPAPWHLPLRTVLGAVLLEADRPADAEAVYREALADHRENGWALFGLARALEAQGKEAMAQEARRDFEQAWARADIWLRSSRF